MFEGKALQDSNSSASLIFHPDLLLDPFDPENQVIYWQSEDSKLGTVEQTIDTAPITPTIWRYFEGNEESPDRLLFIGTGDEGMTFQGNFLFGPSSNWGYMNVIQEGVSVTYEVEELMIQAECNVCITPGLDLAADVGDGSRSFHPEKDEFALTEVLLSIPDERPTIEDFSLTMAYQSGSNTDGVVGRVFKIG